MGALTEGERMKKPLFNSLCRKKILHGEKQKSPCVLIVCPTNYYTFRAFLAAPSFPSSNPVFLSSGIYLFFFFLQIN